MSILNSFSLSGEENVIRINTFIFPISLTHHSLSFFLIFSFLKQSFHSGKKVQSFIYYYCFMLSPLVFGWLLLFFFFFLLLFTAKTTAEIEWCIERMMSSVPLHTTIGITLAYSTMFCWLYHSWGKRDERQSAINRLLLLLHFWSTQKHKWWHKPKIHVFNFIKCKWKRVICFSNNAHHCNIE